MGGREHGSLGAMSTAFYVLFDVGADATLHPKPPTLNP